MPYDSIEGFMETTLKIDLEKKLNSSEPVVINIGCGKKKKPGQIGIDQIDLPEIDIVANIEKGLPFLPDGSVDEVHCRSVLEHIENLEHILREIMRVLKKDGKAFIAVPHFSNPYYYSDPTHVRLFGLYTFYYFVDPRDQLKRKVPHYYSDIKLRILSKKFVFRSEFGIFGFLKKALGKIINRSSLLMEYYEENLVYLMPAHAIEVTITHPQDN